jgi:hypothetical protein
MIRQVSRPVRRRARRKGQQWTSLACLSSAKWADDGSLWQAFIASVRHLAAEKHLDTSVLHGDGTNTVAKKGGTVLGIRGTNTRRARRSSPSPTIMALS